MKRESDIATSDYEEPEWETFRILAQNVPGAVYLCDNDARYTMRFLNTAVEELTGYPAEEFLRDNLSFVDLYHPDDVSGILAQVDQALRQQRPFEILYRLRHADGHYLWVEEHGQGVFDAGGRLRFLEGSIFDVSERIFTEEALRESVRTRTAELAATNFELRKEQELLREMLRGQEREHQLLACEIHDGLVQHATGALMQLQAAQSLLTSQPEQIQTLLDKAGHGLCEAIKEARQIIGGLRPPVLDEMGVVKAIEYLLADLRWPKTIAVEFFHELSDERMSPELETTIFRIVQETLTNICRHSGTSRARIRLEQNAERISLEIQDWGRGFDPTVIREGSFGLRGIRKRVELFGGQLQWDTQPGLGACLRVEFPLT